MENTPKSDIISFIIRFVQTQSEDNSNENTYRGFIRHIQSDKETAFTNWDEVEEFIQDYVPINRKKQI